MPGINYGNAGKAIEIFAPVNVGNDGTAGFVDNDWHNRLHEAGYHIVFVFLDGVGHECLSLHRLAGWNSSPYADSIQPRISANVLSPSARPRFSFPYRT